MIEKVQRYMERHRMTAPGDLVVVGLSGGADSVCLLLLLNEILPEDGRQVAAVHVHHMLRGAEADADEAFVRALCTEHQIPLYVYRYPVAQIAAERGIGTEEAGRLVRQEVWRRCRVEHGAAEIALAHHANDRAETVLFHAARGSSLTGLAGIRPVQKLTEERPVQKLTEDRPVRELPQEERTLPDAEHIRIIRPLLCVSRPEIEAWLAGRGQAWRTDRTNADETYTRNAIRHAVIPYLETHVNAHAVRHITEAAEDLEDADSFLRDEARRRAARHVQLAEDGETIRILPSLCSEPAVIRGRVLLDCVETLCGSGKDLGRTHVAQLQALFSMHTGKQVDLPYRLRGVREYDGIRLYRCAEDPADAAEAEAVPVTGAGIYTWGDWRFTCRLLDTDAPGLQKAGNMRQAVPEKKYTKWLDYDKIGQNLCLRGRKDGDRLVVGTDGGRKKLKAYLIDEKVPRQLRDTIPLLASGPAVHWVIGYRISEAAKVTAQTRRILEIRAERTGHTGTAQEI